MDAFDPFAELRAEREREKALRAARGFPGRSIVRSTFVPFFLACAIAPWFVRGPDIHLSATTGLLWAVLLIWITEQLYPAVPAWNPRPFRDGLKGIVPLLRDAFYLIVVTQLTAWLVGRLEGPLQRAGSWVRPADDSIWPAHAPFALRAGLAFLLVELASYAYHRAAHRFRPLWQFHSTHHATTELRGLKAVQTHPLDNLAFYVVRTLPLICLGAGPDEIAAALYFGGVLGLLAHANIDLSNRGWGLFFNLPAVHGVHHSRVMAESQSNFGCHTVIFDRIFGTYRGQPAQPPALGLEDGQPRTLVQELVAPFHRKI